MRPLLLFLLSIFAGAVTTLAIPPFSYSWLSLITLALFAYNLHQQHAKKSLFLHAFLFGLGFFGTGASWVFVSIHEFGSASLTLALIMTSAFVTTIATAFALPFISLSYFKQSQWRLLLGFPLIWVLSEWLRSWVLTGFPWLYIGYGQISTPLAGWAPIGGVLFVSLLTAFTSSMLTNACLKSSHFNPKILSLLVVIIFWSEGKALKEVEWTQAAGSEITVGLVQPNISQALKWDPEYRQPTLDILTSLSDNLWDKDLVVWPEAAIPDVYFRSQEFLDAMHQQALTTNTSLITGILYDDDQKQKYFNSLLGLGQASGLYSKQRLVPFGEYVPLESLFRGAIDFFDLPTSIISSGDANQPAIKINQYQIASAICYEIVYPVLVAELAKNTNLIITVSNDAWFGKSIGPLQHFHMARMRALETGRYVIRSTNNGVSAIIAPNGDITSQSEQFVRTYLEGKVTPMQGNTPYLIWKNYLVLTFLLLLVSALVFLERRNSTKN
jgi:apolipoprotein N-acyltransferase